MRRARRRTAREPTIALINIVFLMLVFFMVAGSLAPPLDNTLDLIDTRELESRAPPDALVVHADGRLSYRGADVASAAEWLTRAEGEEGDGGSIRIVPDRELPAAKLVALAGELRSAGAERVLIVTERGLE